MVSLCLVFRFVGSDAVCAESKRSSPSLLARQLRLRLVAAEDSDMPKTLSNIIVSIHAIATFQALHDYLRPRVAGLMAGGSRLSSMLAALAASGLAAGSSAAAALAAEASRPPPNESASTGATITRRRSQRLSAKKAGSSKEGESSEGQATQGEGQAAATGSNVLESPEAAPSDTVVNDDEFAAEFTDEEVDVDAEVIDDEGDEEIPEKTVTVSVGDGESHIAHIWSKA